MRNKIRQMMNKEEGFTLVELLAVIVILGIILAIAIPAIGGVISRAQDDSDEQEYALIEDAARLYHLQYEGESLDSVEVSELISEGYLDSRQGEDPEGSVNIETDSNGVSSYTYSER